MEISPNLKKYLFIGGASILVFMAITLAAFLFQRKDLKEVIQKLEIAQKSLDSSKIYLNTAKFKLDDAQISLLRAQLVNSNSKELVSELKKEFSKLSLQLEKSNNKVNKYIEEKNKMNSDYESQLRKLNEELEKAKNESN